MGNSPKSVHIDAALTNMSVSYAPVGFIADIVAPVVNVDKESDKYYVWNRADTFRSYDDKVAAGATAKTIEHSLSTDSYYAEEFSLRARILWREMTNADRVLKLETNKTKKLKDNLLIGRERRVATLLTTAANYDAALTATLSGTSQWDHASYAGDIIKEIDAMAEAVRLACGVRPNTIIIGAAVVPTLTNHSSFRDHYKYTANDIAGNGLPPTLRGMRVLVPGAQYTSSNEGAASTTIADVWGKNVICAFIEPGATEDSFCLAKTFRAQDWQTRKYDVDEQRAEYVETNAIEDVKMVSNIAGYLKKAVVS